MTSKVLEFSFVKSIFSLANWVIMKLLYNFKTFDPTRQ